MGVAVIAPQKSGYCSFPETADPDASHQRCADMGAGNTARPSKEFQPCPCSCHYSADYECGNCGLPLSETNWPDESGDGDEMVYTHLDASGQAIGEECRG